MTDANRSSRLRPRSETWMSAFVGRGRWFTVGGVVYYPDHVGDPWRHPIVLEHEMVHARQQKGSWMPAWLWVLVYLMLPVPILFAYFRWKSEREAYLIDINWGGRSIEEVVDILWSKYAWTWPKFLMRRWFRDAVGD